MMAIDWRLRETLTSRDIDNASELERALREQLGIQLSRTALDKLLKQEPACLKLQTAQILCTLLQTPLSDILTITPEPPYSSGQLIKPYGKKPAKESLIVDPGLYL